MGFGKQAMIYIEKHYQVYMHTLILYHLEEELGTTGRCKTVMIGQSGPR
jgi:hypothetical protein